MAGTLFVVATPIGNLEDITARALRVLGEVSLVAAEDTRRTTNLLSHFAIRTPTVSLHEHNEQRRIPALVERLSRGESIALVSDAGTPTVSDPGRHLIRSALDAGVRVEPVPGPSAILALLSASGLSADRFIFLGFPPTRAKDRLRWFERLESASETVMFFEAPHRILPTLVELQKRLGDRSIVVGRELTKAHEELVDCHISEALRRFEKPRGEFTIAINGHMTDIRPGGESNARPKDDQLFNEFGQLTESGDLSRRAAIAEVAKRHSLPSKIVYQAIERAKISGK